MTRATCDRCNRSVDATDAYGGLPGDWFVLSLERGGRTERLSLCSVECIAPLLRALAHTLEREDPPPTSTPTTPKAGN